MKLDTKPSSGHAPGRVRPLSKTSRAAAKRKPSAVQRACASHHHERPISLHVHVAVRAANWGSKGWEVSWRSRRWWPDKSSQAAGQVFEPDRPHKSLHLLGRRPKTKTLVTGLKAVRTSDMPSKPVWGRELPGGFDSRPPPRRRDQRKRRDRGPSNRTIAASVPSAPQSVNPTARITAENRDGW
jgi:hypothetical protein